MAARSTWRGAINFRVKNYPVPVPIPVDGHAERRLAAIELALAGEITTAQVPATNGAPAAQTPDLMAALEASLAAVEEPKPKRTRKTPAKPTTKAAA